jgi:hypothetical protein
VSDTPKMSVSLSNDPRKWIPAIVGAVMLGEALWSLFQLLLRDWAVPAVMNLLGQGPTQNQNAFLPQPLLVAFVETCLAGIVLVLLMAWSTRRSWTVRVAVDQTATIAVPSTVSASPVMRNAPTVPSASLAPAASTPQPAPGPRIVPPTAPAPSREIETQPPRATVPESKPAPPILTSETAELVDAPAPPVATAAAPKPPAPAPAAKSKKPKKVYYNIVGEPIESDE